MRVRLVSPCPVCGAGVRLMPVAIVDAEDDYPAPGQGVEVAQLRVCMPCVQASGIPVPSRWFDELGGQDALSRAYASLPAPDRRDRFYDLAWRVICGAAVSAPVSLAG